MGLVQKREGGTETVQAAGQPMARNEKVKAEMVAPKEETTEGQEAILFESGRTIEGTPGKGTMMLTPVQASSRIRKTLWKRIGGRF